MDGMSLERLVLVLVFGSGVVISLSIVVPMLWQEYRRRMGVLDVLRAYAERGEEPPESVIQTLKGVSRSGKPGDAVSEPVTRGSLLASAAAKFVAAAGLAGLVWWLVPDWSEPGGLAVVALLAVVFLTARLTARLVAAYYTPPDAR